jgi:hypothetical protein
VKEQSEQERKNSSLLMSHPPLIQLIKGSRQEGENHLLTLSHHQGLQKIRLEINYSIMVMKMMITIIA